MQPGITARFSLNMRSEKQLWTASDCQLPSANIGCEEEEGAGTMRIWPEGTCWVLLRFQVHYNGYLKPFQEPWCYGADVERVCKRFILLRYELIQLW